MVSKHTTPLIIISTEIGKGLGWKNIFQFYFLELILILMTHNSYEGSPNRITHAQMYILFGKH